MQGAYVTEIQVGYILVNVSSAWMITGKGCNKEKMD